MLTVNRLDVIEREKRFATSRIVSCLRVYKTAATFASLKFKTRFRGLFLSVVTDHTEIRRNLSLNVSPIEKLSKNF